MDRLPFVLWRPNNLRTTSPSNKLSRKEFLFFGCLLNPAFNNFFQCYTPIIIPTSLLITSGFRSCEIFNAVINGRMSESLYPFQTKYSHLFTQGLNQLSAKDQHKYLEDPYLHFFTNLPRTGQPKLLSSTTLLVTTESESPLLIARYKKMKSFPASSSWVFNSLFICFKVDDVVWPLLLLKKHPQITNTLRNTVLPQQPKVDSWN